MRSCMPYSVSHALLGLLESPLSLPCLGSYPVFLPKNQEPHPVQPSPDSTSCLSLPGPFRLSPFQKLGRYIFGHLLVSKKLPDHNLLPQHTPKVQNQSQGGLNWGVQLSIECA